MDPSKPAGAASGPRVLYVEDHAISAVLMQSVFDQRPTLQLVVASSGQHALKLAADLEPVLLLLDLNLPDGHGSLLLPRLRQIDGCRTAPAVAVTADHDFDIAGTGFAELWPKPLHVPRALERLDRLLTSCLEARMAWR